MISYQRAARDARKGVRGGGAAELAGASAVDAPELTSLEEVHAHVELLLGVLEAARVRPNAGMSVLLACDAADTAARVYETAVVGGGGTSGGASGASGGAAGAKDDALLVASAERAPADARGQLWSAVS